jgi:DNA-binding FadR family transcriptional regulator
MAQKRLPNPPARKALHHRGNGRGLLATVAEEIGLRIMNGAYAPQTPIPTEPQLMSELDVSRTVLREAIKILAAKGLLETRTKRGTRVRPRSEWNLLDPMILHLYCQLVDYSDFAQSFQQLRVIIEPEAAALAAMNRTGRQLKALEAAYAAMASAQNVEHWTLADLQFHEAILDATGNPFMRPLGTVIRAALETLLFHSAQSAANPFDSLAAHERVLDGIRHQNAGTARQAMSRLLTQTALSISKTIDRKPRTGTGRTSAVFSR